MTEIYAGNYSSLTSPQDTDEIAKTSVLQLYSGIYILFSPSALQADFPFLNDRSVVILCCSEGSCRINSFRDTAVMLHRGCLAAFKCYAADLPLEDFKGIAFVVCPDKADSKTMNALNNFDIDLSVLQHRLEKVNILIVPGCPRAEAIVSQLYPLRQGIKNGYLRLKILELLLCLTSSADEGCAVKNSSHYRTVREIRDYITDNCSIHITIDQLAEKFALSATTLKTAFKTTYGISIYAFAKQYKLQKAAQLLKESDLSVSCIAADIGYDNSSKFATAFRKEYGVSPRQYRNS